MVAVSLKHFVARLWFICPFYFLATQMFRNFSNIKKFIWIYTIPLLLVIGYTLYRHITLGFTQKIAHIAMWPFYNDHTAYAAVIAMFLPVTIAFTFDKQSSSENRTMSGIVSLILIGAIVLSYTRAAWVSLAVGLMVYLIFYFRIRLAVLAVAAITVVLLFFSFRSQILMKLEKNRQESATNFNEHIQSISNITTDASNMERLNRWSSALRMYREKPMFGWGPGTYQFNYASFQQSREKTIISTNFGDAGNAHSEYIGPLAESGFIGLIAFGLIVIAVCYRAALLYRRVTNRQVKLLTLSDFVGLVTYFVHGTLNNFLDTDKASVPFWGFIAILVALDVYHSNKPAEKDSLQLS
jgi:O-antigen ligase